MTSIKSAESMMISGAKISIEIPLDLFQILMMFSETRTARQAFDLLEVDVELDEFGRIIGDFHGRGLLEREQAADDGPGLRELLSSDIFGDAARTREIAGWMTEGRAIIIPDALRSDFAEDVHGELQRLTRWTFMEGGHDFFHHRNCVVDHLADQGAALTRCSRLFSSALTQRFIAELSGEDCAGVTRVTASWYRPGEYALPHNDIGVNDSRSVAFIWYLTQSWRQEWGGSLFWCPTGQYIKPCFNMLIMFRVMPSNMHFICPVAAGAMAKRLTINGFWHRSKPSAPRDGVPEDAWVSARMYGPQAPEAAPVVVL